MVIATTFAFLFGSYSILTSPQPTPSPSKLAWCLATFPRHAQSHPSPSLIFVPILRTWLHKWCPAIHPPAKVRNSPSKDLDSLVCLCPGSVC
ncbi:hypothetical protein EDB80DRAFT_63465 [Ilyonectria destructans]|nr:hypothetical protein EDB80DRAFT_63465 [Ilyonectria destructans]